MAKTSEIRLPREPIGSYTEFGQKYMVFPLKTRCPTLEDCDRDDTKWGFEYRDALLKAITEFKSLFDYLEVKYRQAVPSDLLDREYFYISMIGSSRIVHRETVFGQNEFLASIAISEPRELVPYQYPPLWGAKSRSGMDSELIQQIDLEHLCVLTDINEERESIYSRQKQSVDQLFK